MYDIFSAIPEDEIQSATLGTNGSGSSLYPPGVYACKMNGAISRVSQNTGNSWVKVEYGVLAEMTMDEDGKRFTGKLVPHSLEKPVFQDIFLFQAVSKGNPSMGWKANQYAAKRLILIIQALTGYNFPEAREYIKSEVQAETTTSGGILNIESITSSYADQLHERLTGSQIKLTLEIKQDGEYKVNNVRYVGLLGAGFERDSVEQFLKDGSTVTESTKSEPLEEIPF